MEDSDSVEEEGHTQVAASMHEQTLVDDTASAQFFADRLGSVSKGHSRVTSDISLMVTMQNKKIVHDVDQEVPEEEEDCEGNCSLER